jgi:RNA recognition motif-containing protein
MNIYISNLSVNIIDADLKLLFAAFGEVSFVQIIRDHLNFISRGTALIKMPVTEEGQRAINSLHLSEIDGKQINVIEAKSYITKA